MEVGHFIERGGAPQVSTAIGQKFKIERTDNAHKKFCKYVEIEITGTRKKLFSCTDSSVVYT